jgi:hypothetical protein
MIPESIFMNNISEDMPAATNTVDSRLVVMESQIQNKVHNSRYMLISVTIYPWIIIRIAIVAMVFHKISPEQYANNL